MSRHVPFYLLQPCSFIVLPNLLAFRLTFEQPSQIPSTDEARELTAESLCWFSCFPEIGSTLFVSLQCSSLSYNVTVLIALPFN